MILNIQNKEDFVSKFLTPISKINENAVVKVHKDKITSLITTNDETLILYVQYNEESDVGDSYQNINIPDINRLIKVINCIDNNNIQMALDGNKMVYTSDNINFKYHLLEDGIIATPGISIDKIKKLTFDVTFDLTYSNINSVIKGSTFTVDTDKLYIYTKDGKVNCELTDRQKHNTDSFTQTFANSYTGEDIISPVPINVEIIRLISSLRFDTCQVSIDVTKKVLLFTISADKYTLNFVTVGLIG